MKESTKAILTWAIVAVAFILFYDFLKDYWVSKGENNTKEYYNNELNDYLIKYNKEIAKKDELLIRAVKDRLDEIDKHRKEVAVLENKRAKEKEERQLVFQELDTKLFHLRMENRNLRADVRDLRATLFNFSATNKELSFALNERESTMFDNYNKAMKETEEVVREQYISYLDKIDRVKKMVRK